MKCFILCLSALTLVAQAKAQSTTFRLKNIVVVTNVTYATVGAHKWDLDLFIPGTGSGPFPAAVYIHGGGCVTRNRYWRQAAYMATNGFVGATIDYPSGCRQSFGRRARANPIPIYPDALYDAKASVRFLRANAAEYHIDPNRIAAVGGSLGGWLVTLLGTTAGIPKFDGTEGDPNVSTRVEAVVAFFALTNLVPQGERNPNRAGFLLPVSYAKDPQLWKDASPLYHVNKNSPPMLFLHGTADRMVPYQQSVDMVNKLKADGVRAELWTASGAVHAFQQVPRWYEPSLERMEKFLTSVFKPTS